MEKSADAFRTISEVAVDLVLPQHVLRFWETRFPQIRPLKRAGGRRYYRPADVMLLRSIRQLLYDEGYTIKGVQRLLKEQGARGLRSADPVETEMDAADAPDDRIASIDDDAFVGQSPVMLATLEPTPSAAPWPSGAQESVSDVSGLREALACVEECERILLAVRRQPG